MIVYQDFSNCDPQMPPKWALPVFMPPKIALGAHSNRNVRKWALPVFHRKILKHLLLWNHQAQTYDVWYMSWTWPLWDPQFSISVILIYQIWNIAHRNRIYKVSDSGPSWPACFKMWWYFIQAHNIAHKDSVHQMSNSGPWWPSWILYCRHFYAPKIYDLGANCFIPVCLSFCLFVCLSKT